MNYLTNRGLKSILFSLFIWGISLLVYSSCNESKPKRQDIVWPTNAVFKLQDSKRDRSIETSNSQTTIIARLRFNTRKDGAMILTVKNGNELYDNKGSYVGSVIANKDGSFEITSNIALKGHYIGELGARVKSR